ncbi:MAG: ABC transporter permease [Gammaproteobacteria bacterium]|nr:ABC transporter permease [Gammaproteobacteria bacterium]
MNRLLLRSALRHMQRHPWQTWLSVLGIALGVAVIVAVDLANQSARQAFLLSAESLTGKATHQITGGPTGIPEELYRELRVEKRLRQTAPIVEGLVRLDGETLQLIGIDPLAEADFRNHNEGLNDQAARQFLLKPASVLLSSITARRLGLEPGQDLGVTIAGRQVDLHVIALLEGDNPAVLEGLLLADISTAQELLDSPGRLDRIDLILRPDQVHDLTAALPAGLNLEIPESRSRVMLEMIDAFQINLAAMSLLAMLVGAFLIYNTMTFSVLRRRRLLATLRVLGVTRGELFRVLLLEAILMGLFGTALGLLLGLLIAEYLVQLVTRTINDLYFVLTVTQLIVQPLTLLKGCLVGLGVTLLAALAPAIEAAGTLPISALRRSRLEQRVRRGLPWVGLLGLAALIGGGLWLSTSGNSLLGGFSGLFLIIAGYSLLVPLGVALLSRLSERSGKRGSLLLRFALRGIGANLSRTGLSVASLSVAVAATLGVSIMIVSFRSTVADWLAYTLTSDIYVSAISSRASSSDTTLLPETRGLIQSLPEVAETSTGRRVTIRGPQGPVDLLVLDFASNTQQGFRFLEPPLPELWTGYQRGDQVLISEPYAYRYGLGTGDRLTLDTLQGSLNLTIGGVFYDYGSDRGLISLSASAYARYWGDTGYASVGVILQPGIEPSAAMAAIRKALTASDQQLHFRSNRELRDYSMAIFDRTFAITQVLRLLAIGVAFIGVLSALMALQLERSREQALLRATGVTPGQLIRLTLLQTGLVGCYAGLFALPLGWLMSEVLIEVINRRAFGWSITSQLPLDAVFEALLLAVFAALLAGLYPAWRMGRVSPALALREE